MNTKRLQAHEYEELLAFVIRKLESGEWQISIPDGDGAEVKGVVLGKKSFSVWSFNEEPYIRVLPPRKRKK